MKKQIVLSLSVLVVAMSSDLFAPVGFKTKTPVAAPAVQRNNTSPAVQQPSVEPAVNKMVPAVSADAEIVAQGMSLSDVYVALGRLGAKTSDAVQENVDKAMNFIQSGTASSSSGNKSHMLGRLGNNKNKAIKVG